MPEMDAIGMVVADMERTVSFYRMVGLDIPEGAEGEGHVDVRLSSGMRLMFDSYEIVRSFRGFEPAEGGDRAVALAVRCDRPEDVDGVYARLTAAGHRGDVAPFDAVWGQRYATVLDPDGNPVDLYAELGA